MRYLSVMIYKAMDEDFTNNGATAITKGKIFVVPCEEGPLTEEEVRRIPERYVVLEFDDRMIRGQKHTRLVPMVDEPGFSNKVMFGGNFAWSCDSRFRRISDLPLPVHDRVED